eukprot:11164912-Lingulodinium_polyedra.AAC.1
MVGRSGAPQKDPPEQFPFLAYLHRLVERRVPVEVRPDSRSHFWRHGAGRCGGRSLPKFGSPFGS